MSNINILPGYLYIYITLKECQFTDVDCTWWRKVLTCAVMLAMMSEPHRSMSDHSLNSVIIGHILMPLCLLH